MTYTFYLRTHSLLYTDKKALTTSAISIVGSVGISPTPTTTTTTTMAFAFALADAAITFIDAAAYSGDGFLAAVRGAYVCLLQS